MVRKVSTVAPHDSASVLRACFDRGEVALVVEGERVTAVLSKIDLIDYLANQDDLAVRMAAVPAR